MPNNWKTYKLEELTTKLGDGLHGTPKYSSDGEYYFINGNNLTDGKIEIKQNTKRVNKDQFIKYQKPLNDKTIFVSINGTLGNVATYNNEKVVLGKSACYFNVKEDVHKEFIKQYVSTSDFKRFLENNATGSVIKNVSLKSMREYELNLPPLKEQKAIANILSAIDDKIENNLAINKTLEEMAMAIYKHWFVDFSPFKEGEFVDSELGKIPKGWEVKPISEVFEVRDGTHDSPKRKEYGHYLITSKHLKGNTIDYSSAYKISKADFDKVNNRSLVEKGDILMTMIGTVGNFFFVNHKPDYAIKNIGLFKTSNVPNLQSYLYSFFKSKICQDYISGQMSGSTQQYITLKTLRNFPVIFPESNVIEKYTVMVRSNFNKIDYNVKENQILTKLRDTLLPKLISGEIRLKEFQEKVAL